MYIFFFLLSISIVYSLKPKSSFLFHKPNSVNQQKYVELLNNEKVNIILVNGPAGTGKTLFACNTAIKLYEEEKINRIVLTRPLVSVNNEDVGYLPGSLTKKMDPWVKPITDIFLKYYSTKQLEDMLRMNKIEICPMAYMRGRTFEDCFIIADEMQNSTPMQMLMMTTRLGERCKLVIMGDNKQMDNKNETSGFMEIQEKYNDYILNHEPLTNIKLVELNDTDISRSQVVKDMLSIYNYKKPFDLKEVSRKNSDSALIPKNHITKNYML